MTALLASNCPMIAVQLQRYVDPIKKGFLTTKGTKKHELFLEFG